MVCTAPEGVSLAVGAPPWSASEVERLNALAGAVMLAVAGVVSAVIVAVRRRRAIRATR